jgi:hypothetical protein
MLVLAAATTVMAILHLQMEEVEEVPEVLPEVLFLQGVREELEAMQVEAQMELELPIQLAPVVEVVRLVLVRRLLLPLPTEETVVQVQIHQ